MIFMPHNFLFVWLVQLLSAGERITARSALFRGWN